MKIMLLMSDLEPLLVFICSVAVCSILYLLYISS